MIADDALEQIIFVLAPARMPMRSEYEFNGGASLASLEGEAYELERTAQVSPGSHAAASAFTRCAARRST